MILVKHESYDEYIKIQLERTKRRTNYGRRTLSWISEGDLLKVNELIHLYSNGIKTMVCHGCRNGLEVDVLQKLNPDAKVFGTDLYGKAYKYDRNYFREMDFDDVPENWMGYFDVIYSNSIDHSRNPINTLLSWKSELKENGICFVVFHWGSDGNIADCFHLSKDCLQICGDIPKYEVEVKDIAEKVMMKTLYISKPYTVNRGRGYSTNVILKR